MNKNFINTLYTGDNLDILHGINSNSVDLIYIDPPFNSKRIYHGIIKSKAAEASFKDIWTWDDVDESRLQILFDKYPKLVDFIFSIQDKAMMSYITFMAQRIVEFHRVLKETGSMYLHCDPTASHYLKIVMDHIFGEKNFRNEIIWCYDTTGRSKQVFCKKHDIILFYSKSKKFKFNTPRTKERGNANWKTDKDGRQYYITGNGYTYYKDEGVLLNDWWTDIKALQTRSKEKTGYPTQKPLDLLERIIKVSSNPGDIVLDGFCGCATTCVSANINGRYFIGIDLEKKSAELVVQRLQDKLGIMGKIPNFAHITKAPIRTDINKEQPTKDVKHRLYGDQAGKCKGCGDQFEIRHLEVDHITPKSKGGQNFYENYQLLCGNCNRRKGNRPMEYFLTQRKHELAQLKINSF